MFVSAIIVAAGSSTRMGTGKSKQFEIIKEKTVIEHTLRAFNACDGISEMVVVCRPEDEREILEIAQGIGLKKALSFAYGADSRAGSVMNGIKATDPKAQYFAIHDGARPLIKPELIENVLQSAYVNKCAAPAIPVTDTIKVVENGVAVSTPDRSTLRAVQTPQVFEKDIYLSAASNISVDNFNKITDDCMLVESVGYSVSIVDGDKSNIKITTPLDIKLAEALMEE